MDQETQLETDLAASRDSSISAGEVRARARRGRLGWPDVLRVLETDETRSLAVGLYRAEGWTPDDFGRPRGAPRAREAREAMADALTRTEDWLELATVRQRYPTLDAQRARIQEVRHALELELWP